MPTAFSEVWVLVEARRGAIYAWPRGSYTLVMTKVVEIIYAHGVWRAVASLGLCNHQRVRSPQYLDETVGT